MASPFSEEAVTRRVEVAGASIEISLPPSAEDLIDEAEYARDERLPYWAELWPSARVLADEMARREIAGLRILELGCGVALPSIVALRGGADPLATDWYDVALEWARANARRAAGRDLATMVVDWFQPPDALVALAPFDLVIGADVLYESRNGGALLELLPGLVPPGGELLIADPRRPDAASLLAPLHERGWTEDVREVQYEGPRDESGAVVRLHSLRRPDAPGLRA